MRSLHPRWFADAACRAQGTDRFFASSTAAAKKVCAGCTVRPQCLHLALEENHVDGVWGGLDPNERLILKERFSRRGVDVPPTPPRAASAGS